jgi:lysophospholipid acyltransferase (LPLAT)-like uncharacterized protein
MGLLKRIGYNERFRGLMCWLGALYIRLVHATGRWTVIGGDAPAQAWDSGRPFILAFWHGRILMMPKSWRAGVPINMLISHHRDGQLIARTVSHFGISWLAGSSTHGGSAALRTMLKVLKAGECVGITPDGPKGPRMRATLGIVNAARLSGCPIIPATFGVRRRRVLNSWDRFIVALPFSRGVFVWGAPISVPRDADQATLEQIRQTVESELNRITDQADAWSGTATTTADPVEVEA